MRDRRKAPRRSATWPARVAGAIVLICAAVVAIFEPFPVERVRLLVFDLLQRAAPRETVKPWANPVVVVGIDEKSLANLGPWPWPRARLADLAGRLADSGARVVAFDIVFAEADRWSVQAGADGDAAFAAAIEGRPIVLGMGAKPPDGWAAIRPYPGRTVAIDGEHSLRHLLRVEGLLRNIPELERRAAGLGAFLLYNDGDGITRRVPTVLRTPEGVIPSFSAEALRVGLGAKGLRVEDGMSGLQAIRLDGGPAIATDADGNVWPHFSRLQNREILSAVDVLDGAIGRERIAGRYVLVGGTAAGLGDVRVSPLGQSIPGVEIHAQALEGALGGTLLVRPGYLIGAEFVCLVVSGLLAILGFTVCSAALLLPALMAEVAALGWLSWSLFVGQHLLFDVSLSVVTVFVLFAAIVAVRQSRTGHW